MIEDGHPDALNTHRRRKRSRIAQASGIAVLIVAGIITGARLWHPVQKVEQRIATPIRDVVKRASPLEQLSESAASACPSVVSLHPPGVQGAAPQAVLIDPNGLAVTAALVPAQGNFDAWIDGRKLTATMQAHDASTGLSLLKLDGTGLPAITLADPDIAPPGTWGFILSSPNGTGCITDQGVVASDFATDGATLDYYVRIHGPTEPVPAGAPFFSSDGRVLGLAQPATGTGARQDRYLPADLVTVTVNRLMRQGEARPDIFGFVAEDLSPVLAARLGADRGRGAVIVVIARRSIAEKAGLHIGDVILSAAHLPISGASELTRILGGEEPVELIVTRGRERTQMTFTLTPAKVPHTR